MRRRKCGRREENEDEDEEQDLCHGKRRKLQRGIFAFEQLFNILQDLQTFLLVDVAMNETVNLF